MSTLVLILRTFYALCLRIVFGFWNQSLPFFFTVASPKLISWNKNYLGDNSPSVLNMVTMYRTQWSNL